MSVSLTYRSNVTGSADSFQRRRTARVPSFVIYIPILFIFLYYCFQIEPISISLWYSPLIKHVSLSLRYSPLIKPTSISLCYSSLMKTVSIFLCYSAGSVVYLFLCTP
jgi:hypothetical protein